MRDELLDTELGKPAGVLANLARSALGTMSDSQRMAGLTALRSTMNRRRSANAARRTNALIAGGLVSAAAAVLMLRHERHPAMSFHVDGADIRPGGYVEASPSTHPVLRFSDGSEVALAGQARVHVRTIDEHGARVTLDEGQAHVYVVHSAETRWMFDAGPFVVAVTGTAFGISWAADEGRLDVRLENGSVTVSGPVSDAPLALRAGQWLTVRANDVLIRGLDAPDAGLSGAPPLRESETSVGMATEPAALAEPSNRVAAASEDAPSHHANPGRARRTSPDAERVDHAWTTDLADGKFDAIVDDATRMGLDAAFGASSSDELAALADAARYTRRHDLARGALLAQRRRYPASDHARVAAFSLGRLSETENDPRAALAWFEDYLTEAPDGTFASEALGRKMTIVQRLDGKDSARPLAQTYLRRFPSGTYAQAAKALTLRP